MHPSISVYLKDTQYGPNKGGLQILDEITEPRPLPSCKRAILAPWRVSLRMYAVICSDAFRI